MSFHRSPSGLSELRLSGAIFRPIIFHGAHHFRHKELILGAGEPKDEGTKRRENARVRHKKRSLVVPFISARLWFLDFGGSAVILLDRRV